MSCASAVCPVVSGSLEGGELALGLSAIHATATREKLSSGRQ